MFKNVYENLSNMLLDGKETALLTFMNPAEKQKGTIEKKLLIAKGDLEKDENLPLALKDKIISSFKEGIPLSYSNGNETVLVEPFFPKPRLVILGGGHIAKPLVEFGHKVGFSVVVVDDRPFFANPARFPEASQVICEDFGRVFDRLNLKESDFVVIVTRGHRHDGICLRQTLNYNPAYTGMIGSKRRVREMMELLIEEGYNKERLSTIKSPIGVSIGAVTPEEIAISIIAEVISCRREIGTSKSNNEKFNWPEFDTDVMKKISEKDDDPKALVTIISSKGSVPRKAGAKMIVWLDGRTLGSIGGGCSEANIATISRDIILNKGYIIEHVDMTGLVAEEEGMVCGGTMDVLIEAF